jgi:arsenite-transporting ATPase
VRVILYTGKGGVGKTSVAAASAVLAADRGLRTILISTDAAHSVADSFDVDLPPGRHQLGPNLWIHEIDALQELEANWNRVHSYFKSLIASQGIDEIVADELASPPGMTEVAGLMWIRKYYKERNYDVVIVDCAPTGETMQLLAFPEVARWWLRKIFPIERKIMKVARPVLQPIMDIPLPKDEVFASVKDLLLDLDGTREILADPETTSMRLVVNLEKMVIKEAQRAYTYLNLYDYQTDAVIINRVLPPSAGKDAFLDGWRKSQRTYQSQVRKSFGSLPLLEAPLFETEVVGEAMLRKMGEALFAKHDPVALLHRGKSQRLVREGGDYVLELDLPFVDKGDLDLVQRDSELYVRVGPYKREISLPRVLARRRSRGARFEGSTLKIVFASEDGPPATGGPANPDLRGGGDAVVAG